MFNCNLFIVFALLLSLGGAARAADMVYPSPDIAPAEVIAIQLKGLQYNNTPKTDAGIRQTWAFAHPRNRAVTGPLHSFSIMLKGPVYGKMLDHLSHQIVPKKSGDAWQQFDVFMEVSDGQVMHFSWIVEKVDEGRYKGCWMTVAVSPPLLTGQGS